MSDAKRLIEKKESLFYFAKQFLINEKYIEEALDGSLHGKVYSDNSIIYIKANNYYTKNSLKNYFNLAEFRDEIKHILDTIVTDDAFAYDLERMD